MPPKTKAKKATGKPSKAVTKKTPAKKASPIKKKKHGVGADANADGRTSRCGDSNTALTLPLRSPLHAATLPIAAGVRPKRRTSRSRRQISTMMVVCLAPRRGLSGLPSASLAERKDLRSSADLACHRAYVPVGKADVEVFFSTLDLRGTAVHRTFRCQIPGHARQIRQHIYAWSRPRTAVRSSAQPMACTDSSDL